MCFTKTGYPNITSGTITTVATQTYIIRPTPDQVAAGETPYKITFVSTEIVNGYVQVKDSVTGIESQVSCKNIIPAVCL